MRSALQRRVPALARAHADRGVALGELGVVEAVGDRVQQVLHGLVLVEVDEVLARRMREDRPGVAAAFGLAPARCPCAPSAHGSVRDRVAMVDRAGEADALRHALDAGSSPARRRRRSGHRRRRRAGPAAPRRPRSRSGRRRATRSHRRSRPRRSTRSISAPSSRAPGPAGQRLDHRPAVAHADAAADQLVAGGRKERAPRAGRAPPAGSTPASSRSRAAA